MDNKKEDIKFLTNKNRINPENITTLAEEFKNSMQIGDNNIGSVFCFNPFKIRSQKTDEVFFKCHDCKRNLCISCKNLCHKNKKCGSNIIDYKPLIMVTEFSSSCECDHDIPLDKNSKEMKKPCFTTFFLSVGCSDYEITALQVNGNCFNVCKFCKEICTKEKNFQYDPEKGSKVKDLKFPYKCACITSSTHSNPVNFYYFLGEFLYKDSSYSRNSVQLVEDAILKFNVIGKRALSKYGDLPKNCDQEKFGDIMRSLNFINEDDLLKIKIHHIIYKSEFKIDDNELEDIMGKMLKQLNDHSPIYFNSEKINFVLTLINYYFYSKLFSQVKLINVYLINSLSYEERIKLHKQNAGILREIREKHNTNDEERNFFTRKKVEKIFNNLLELRSYTIKLSPEEEDVPFITNFIKLFVQTYAFEVEFLETVFKILRRIKYKEGYNKYNNLMRKDIDEIIYLTQIYLIDMNNIKHLQEISKNKSNNNNKNIPNTELVETHASKIFENYFFKWRPKVFQDYFIKMYDKEEVYLEKIHDYQEFNFEEKTREQDEYEKVIKNNLRMLTSINEENICYFDSLHYSFLDNNFKNTYFDFNNSNEINSPGRRKELAMDSDAAGQNAHVELSNSSSNIPVSNHFEYFKSYRIETYKTHGEQQKALEIIITTILEEYNLKFRQKSEFKIKNPKLFLEYLLLSIKGIQVTKKNKKRNNDITEVNTVIDLSDYLTRSDNLKFDTSKVDLTKYLNNIRFVLHKIFVEEYHKFFDFTNMIFDWNILLILFICNRRNLSFLLDKVGFFDFLFHVHFADNRKKVKKSFLIRSLYNFNENVTEINYTWKVFYYIFKLYIDNHHELFHYKKRVEKDFTCEIIGFYIKEYNKCLTLHLKDKEKYKKKLHSLRYTMNYCLIYFFLKTINLLLIESNLNICYPYSFNINKFETIEKINIIANILFENNEPFDIHKYLKSYEDLTDIVRNTNNENNKIPRSANYGQTKRTGLDIIQEESDYRFPEMQQKMGNACYEFGSNAKLIDVIIPNDVADPVHVNIELAEAGKLKKYNVKKPVYRFIIKKIDLVHCQYLLFDLMGKFYTSSDVNVYYKIIKNNFNVFSDILGGNVHEIENLDSKLSFEIHIIILEFLINFLTIKHYDYFQKDLVSDLNLSNDILHRITQLDPATSLSIEINSKDISEISIYLVNKIRMEILDLLIKFIEDLGSDIKVIFVPVDKFHILGIFMLNHLAKYLRYMKMKSDDKLNIQQFENKFMELIAVFLTHVEKKLFFKDIKFHANNFDYKGKKICSVYQNYQKNLSQIFEELEKDVKNEKRERKFTRNITTMDRKAITGNDQIKNSLKKNMTNNQSEHNIVEGLMNFRDDEFLKRSFNGMDSSQVKSYFEQYLEYDNRKFSMYSRIIRKYITGKQKKVRLNLISDNDNYENDLRMKYINDNTRGKIEQKINKRVQRKTWNKLRDQVIDLQWAEIKKIFEEVHNESLTNLMKYLFTNLQIIENLGDNVKDCNFEYIFSDNFLKSIYFFNNLLYRYGFAFQSYLTQELSVTKMKILLKNVYKINNYIIAISESENNDKLMTLSKIYFILMDFFILLAEGVYEGDIMDYFFMDLEDDEKDIEINEEKAAIIENIEKEDENQRETYKHDNDRLESLYIKKDPKVNSKANFKKNPQTTNAQKQTNLDIYATNIKSQNIFNQRKFKIGKQTTLNEQKLHKLNRIHSIKDFHEEDDDEINTSIILNSIDKQSQILVENFCQRIQAIYNSYKSKYTDEFDIKKDADKIENYTYMFMIDMSDDVYQNYLLKLYKVNEEFSDFPFTRYEEEINAKFEYYQCVFRIFCDLINAYVRRYAKKNFEEISKHNYTDIMIDLHQYSLFNKFLIDINSTAAEKLAVSLKDNSDIQTPIKMNFDLLNDGTKYLTNFINAIRSLHKDPSNSSMLDSFLFVSDDFLRDSETCIGNMVNVLEDYKKCIIDYTQKYNMRRKDVESSNKFLNENEEEEELNIEIDNEYNSYVSRIGTSLDFMFKAKNIFTDDEKNTNTVSSKKAKAEELNKVDKKAINASSKIDIKNFNKLKDSAFKKEIIIQKSEVIMNIDNEDNKRLKLSQKKFETFSEISKEKEIQKERIKEVKLEQKKKMKMDKMLRKLKMNIESDLKKEGNKNMEKAAYVLANEDGNAAELDEEDEESESDTQSENNALEIYPTSNFYYYNFQQMKYLIELLNKCRYSNYSHGSDRLIVQYLYISRYLKEFLELEDNEKNQKNKLIVDYCFMDLFDFKWILSSTFENNEYSAVIRLGILTLLNAYLEENIDEPNQIFLKRLNTELNENLIFYEIIHCLKIIEDYIIQGHMPFQSDSSNNLKSNQTQRNSEDSSLNKDNIIDQKNIKDNLAQKLLDNKQANEKGKMIGNLFKSRKQEEDSDEEIDDEKDNNRFFNFGSDQNISFDDIFFFYINEENIIRDKNFELAELYYKLLRKIQGYYQKLEEKYKKNELSLEKYRLDSHKFEKEIEEEMKIDKVKALASVIKESNKMTREFNDKKIKNKPTSVIQIINYYKTFNKYFKFLSLIGRGIEVKYLDFDSFSDKPKIFKRHIYFFKSPKCYWLNNSIKNSFIEKTPRRNLGAKLDFLIKKFDKFLVGLNLGYIYRPKLRYLRKYPSCKRFVNFISYAYSKFEIYLFDMVNFFFVVVINVLLLIYYYEKVPDQSKNDINMQIYLYEKPRSIGSQTKFTERQNYILWVAIANACIQFILLAIWMYFRYSIKLGSAFYKHAIKDKTYYLYDGDESKFYYESFKIYQNIVQKYKNTDDKFLKIASKSEDGGLNWLEKIYLFFLPFKKIFWSKEIFLIIFTFICHIAFFCSNYKLLLVLPIISITNLYPLFDYFFRAMVDKYQQFVAILIFIYFIKYIFSWITFLHFQEFMISDFIKRDENVIDPEAKNELLCSTAIECFLNYVDLGLRAGGGMGDVAPRVSFKYDTNGNYFLKFFWDIIFHIIVNLILGNIFFGIIVDTFNEMREKRDKEKEDKENKCFMCNRDRYDNVQGLEFDDHRDKEHKIFDYVYFIPYLIKKNIQEYSRAEQFAWEKIHLKEIDWLPGEVDGNDDEEDDD